MDPLSQHLDKIMFIQRLQAKEGLLNKFLNDGGSLLPRGGGLGHGGGLGRGGGLEAGGFYTRKPAVREQMLEDKPTYTVVENEGVPEANQVGGVGAEETVDVVAIQGKTSQPWKKQKKQIEDSTGSASSDNKTNGTVHDLIKGLEKKDFGSQTRTKSVLMIRDGSNEVLKYRSLGDLARQTKMSKYSLIGKFQAKSVGDSVHSKKLGGTLVFVNKSDLVNF